MNTLPLARDLPTEARQAAEAGRVFVVLFGTQSCPWCAKVRRNYLVPLSRETSGAAVVIREIDAESGATLIDFTGARTDHRSFARAQAIRFVPVVAFFGVDGRSLAEPIVGMSSEDFYGAYLEERIAAARAKSAAVMR